ncbi:MAG: DUF2807 domain-containing protein [Gemmatimonadetes bacterium]|nr:DUF2807 domain-containing protein [Gemmatimonadota bacterium]
MTKTTKLLGLFAAVVLVGGCGDIFGEQVIRGRGPVVIESRPVGHFTGVSNDTEAEVEIIHGFTDRVFIHAEENLLPYLRTRVQNGTLRIYTDDVTLRPRYPIVVEVDIVTLRRVESSGRGFMRAQLIDATRLEVSSSGTGDIDLPGLQADSLIVLHSGTGDVTAAGQVDRLRLDMSAAGRVDTRDLEAFDADVTISGSGSGTIRVRDSLKATLSGSGWLRYFGSPEVEQHVTGTGRVERQGG